MPILSEPLVSLDANNMYITCEVPTEDPSKIDVNVLSDRTRIEFTPDEFTASHLKIIRHKVPINPKDVLVTFRNGILDITLPKLEAISDGNSKNGNGASPLGGDTPQAGP